MINLPTLNSQASRTALLIAGVLTLGACSSSNDSTATTGSDNTTSFAFSGARASDYSSGRIDRISLTNGNTVDGSYPATGSDIAVTTDGTDLYQIGRFGIDSITRFDPIDTSVVDYQYSVNTEGEGSANPQAIAFLNDSKAYLTRRGSGALWIINPNAASEEEFKIGEIDLSAYDTGSPDMTNAIIVGDKLFVVVERLLQLEPFGQVPDKSAYLVVIDTATDTEIQTGEGNDGLAGIELSVRNPSGLQYNEATGDIFVVGRGNFNANDAITDDFYSGGIEVIDPDSYVHSVLLDDGTAENNQGYFYDIEIINANLGYLLTYADFGVTTLRTFNPVTGMLSDTLFEGLQDVDITDIAQGPDNHLWVGILSESNGFLRIDLDTQLLAEEMVTTELVPLGVTFIDVENQ